MMKKKIAATVIVGVLAIAGAFIGLKYAASAEDYQAKQKLEAMTKGEHGKINLKGTKALSGSLVETVFEDDTYTYEMTAEGGLVGIGIKSSEYGKYDKVKGNLSEVDATKKAEEYIQKYAPAEGFSYILKRKVRHSDSARDEYQLDYEGVVSNGIGTGDGISIWLNMNGDLGMFAHYKGNKDLAMSAKPTISKQDAEKIALNKVYSNLNNLNKTLFPKLTIESSLKIDKDILVYDVTVSPEDKTCVFPTYYFKIDAKNGTIVYEDVAG